MEFVHYFANFVNKRNHNQTLISMPVKFCGFWAMFSRVEQYLAHDNMDAKYLWVCSWPRWAQSVSFAGRPLSCWPLWAAHPASSPDSLRTSAAQHTHTRLFQSWHHYIGSSDGPSAHATRLSDPGFLHGLQGGGQLIHLYPQVLLLLLQLGTDPLKRLAMLAQLRHRVAVPFPQRHSQSLGLDRGLLQVSPQTLQLNLLLFVHLHLLITSKMKLYTMYAVWYTRQVIPRSE